MTISELSLSTKKMLAQKIRKLIEPDGTSSKAIIKEIEIRRLIKNEVNIIISGISEVIAILETYYVKRTVTRLISKVQQSVVWDASICNLELEKLNYLFYNKAKNNIFSNLTINELQDLVKNETTPSINSEKAKFLCASISKDNESKHSTIVTLFKSSKDYYVDTVLLEYCQKNNYSLYTYDYSMGLRAKSMQIDVTIFNNINSEKVPKYTPSANAILLHSDLLESTSLDTVISMAKKINGGKFILTTQFIEQIEKNHSNELVKDFVRFFLYDENNSYTMYLSNPKSEKTIIEIAKEHNATIFTANIKTAIFLKSEMCKYEVLLPAVDDYILNIPNSANNAIQDVIIDKNSRIIRIPGFVNKNKSISLKKLHPNEKVWFLNPVSYITSKTNKTNKNEIKLFNNQTIIYGINYLNNSYKLKVIDVMWWARTKWAARPTPYLPQQPLLPL